MYFDQLVTVCLSYFFVFGHTISSAPAHSVSSEQPDVHVNLPSDVQTPFNRSTIDSGSSLAKYSPKLEFTTVTWPITDTLSLKANIGPWQLSPDRILETLKTAATTVGKKRAEPLLEKKFTQEQGSRINTMLFEIGPAYEVKQLTWADVGEVLDEEKGLPKFFEEYGVWTSTYFDVIDSVRGKLGEGAVRKWYQLEPPIIGNGTVVGGGDIVAAYSRSLARNGNAHPV